MHMHTKEVARGGIIAALYVVLTLLANAFGLANYAIQLRFSEALCVLPFFLPEAIPALTIGCLLSNLLIGAPLFDVLFGSLATLLGALGARLLRRYPLLVPLPTVLANAAIIPPILLYAYGLEGTYFFFLATVTAGEVISAYALGLLLLYTLKKRGKRLFTK